MRDIHVEELLGFRDALIERACHIDLSEFHPLDIVGTGGDGKNTFNISTCACFVVAGAGYKVAKHGNYGASSVSGASTVLEQHGVKFTNDADQLKRSIDQCGMAYLHAPLFHPALAAVGPLRKASIGQPLSHSLSTLGCSQSATDETLHQHVATDWSRLYRGDEP